MNYYYDLPEDIINLINVKVNNIYMREHKHKMNKVFMVITTAKKYMDKLTPDESISKFMKLQLYYFDALIT